MPHNKAVQQYGSADELLVRIARCANVQCCLRSGAPNSHRCSDIVLSQAPEGDGEHQVPEP